MQSNVYLCRYQLIGKKNKFEPYVICTINETIWENNENTPSRNLCRTQQTPKRSARLSKGILKEDNLVNRMKRLSVAITPYKIVNSTIVQLPAKNSSEHDSDTDESPSKRSKKDSDSDSKPLSEYIKVSPIKIVRRPGQKYECQKSASKKANHDETMDVSETEGDDKESNKKSKSKIVRRNLILDEHFVKTPTRKALNT